ncbi:MAG: hypothetical protein J5680_07900 [Neisseriaceae bacterium]|nr:hypothetical protein [Neisseriaceae bacterium]
MIGWFFAEVLMGLIIEREKEKPHYLSWKASLLIVLMILTVIVFLII